MVLFFIEKNKLFDIIFYMVNFLRKKNSPVKICILKSRKLDFFRINPVAIINRGFNRLIRKGILEKGTKRPDDNPNFFLTPAFFIHWAETRFNDGNLHVGFTVSVKSISKRANKRNLIRRRLRYAINKNIRNFNIKGYDFVITARSGSLNMNYKTLEHHINRALKFIENKIQPQK